ncbi:PaaI family thioesterase [Novosphingobium sp. Gsoil 351]|uniref:PaaI family thioesterase n=1 Tax=Novosphingobium sp. Gsoil 351 TaxID=2675225 RepID=UPI0018A803CC|nr:PaaI family thioesterase [Novosphingobium sp. Gsoil 351]
MRQNDRRRAAVMGEDMSDGDFTSLEGLRSTLGTTPIHRWLGFEITEVDRAAGTLTMTCPAGGNSSRYEGAGQAHGGAIATLIDSAATFACAAMLGRGVPTSSIRVDYLRPAGGTLLVAKARVIRRGRTLALVDVEVESDGKLVATGRCVEVSAA